MSIKVSPDENFNFADNQPTRRQQSRPWSILRDGATAQCHPCACHIDIIMEAKYFFLLDAFGKRS